MTTAMLVLVVAPPLLAALAAPLLALFFVMSASAFNGPEAGLAFNTGLWSMIGYFAVYFVLIAGVALSTVFKWPLVGLFHALIWLAFIIFVAILVWSFTVLNAQI